MFKFVENALLKSKEEKEMKDAIESLVEESALSKKFVILTALSAMIASMGLSMNSPTILIGAMLIAPLLIPVVSLSVGIGSGSVKLVTHSIKSLVVGLSVAILSSAAISWFFTNGEIHKELYDSFTDSYLYSIIAFLSGIVAVYSWLKPNKDQILPGVTIAVALVPPIAFAGTVIVFQNQEMLIDILQLIFINLGGIFLGGLVTFLLFAFFSKRPTLEVDKQVDSEVEKKTK